MNNAANHMNGEGEERGPEFTGPLTLDHWAKRDLSPRDRLLGNLFSTTSRGVFSADTGVGKTNFAMALAFHMAGGVDFCHWRVHRKARVLFIDGEMPRELMQERLADAERRLGFRPDQLFVLCKEDFEDMPALDDFSVDGSGNVTWIGQRWVEWLIAHLGGVDFIIFDNLGTLTIGNPADPESWLPMVAYVKWLTANRIGQLWITHTGHDKTRDYGPRARLWLMDLAMVGVKIDGHSADIALRLDFAKARLRTPHNRADFEPVDVVLDQDQWFTSAPVKPKKKRSGLGPHEKTVLNALETAIQHSGEPSKQFSGMPTSGLVTTVENLEGFAMAKLPHEKAKARNQAFRRALESLVANKWIGKHDQYLWSQE